MLKPSNNFWEKNYAGTVSEFSLTVFFAVRKRFFIAINMLMLANLPILFGQNVKFYFYCLSEN
jgi:hypothetical protein